MRLRENVMLWLRQYPCLIDKKERTRYKLLIVINKREKQKDERGAEEWISEWNMIRWGR